MFKEFKKAIERIIIREKSYSDFVKFLSFIYKTFCIVLFTICDNCYSVDSYMKSMIMLFIIMIIADILKQKFKDNNLLTYETILTILVLTNAFIIQLFKMH